MIVLSKQELRRLQLTELELLKEVDRVCRVCGIPYNIIAGTLLGARRHGGFIPWDDDIDVAMMRKDYDRFVLACRKYLDRERFEFQDHNETPGYRWGYGKLRMKDTLYQREYQEHMPYFQGVFMDIFPMDYVSDSRIWRALKNFHCFCLRKMLWSKVGMIAEKALILRVWYNLLNRVPEQLIKRSLNKMIASSRRKETSWVRILMIPTPNRQYGYRAEWYRHSVDTEFEGTVFPGIADYEAYLTFKFGAWRNLPPENLRKKHPASAVRLPAAGEEDVS